MLLSDEERLEGLVDVFRNGKSGAARVAALREIEKIEARMGKRPEVEGHEGPEASEAVERSNEDELKALDELAGRRARRG